MYNLKTFLLGGLIAASLNVHAQAAATLTQVTTTGNGAAVLANTLGGTLYVFDVDQGKATPACAGACAEIWPPYLLSDAEMKEIAAPYGAIHRASAQNQLTFNGRPVYTYAFDRKSGDDLGNGLGNVWHVIGQK